VRSNCDPGDVFFITGDLNNRTRDRPDYVENINLQRYVTMPGIEEYVVANRKSQGKQINNFGLKLLTFCKEHDLTIFNGRLDDGKCTYFTVNRRSSGCSLIDYLMTNRELFDFIKNFEVRDINECSDHYAVIYSLLKGGVEQWVARLSSWVRVPSNAPVVSLSKKLYPYCLILVGSRNGFERDFTIELK